MIRRLAIDAVRLGAGTLLLSDPLRRSWRRARGQPAARKVIFYYHRVFREDVQPLFQIGVHRDLFRRQLVDLSRTFRFLPLLDLLEAPPDDTQDLASLTFDDGYADNHTEALPILRELGIPATVFLVTGLIGTPRLLWYDAVKRIFERHPGPTLPLPAGLGGGSIAIPDQTARRRELDRLLERLKRVSDATRRGAVEALTASNAAAADGADPRDRLLTWEEARAMEERGVRFGSHTASHAILPTIDDDELLRGELAGSLQELHRNLRHPIPVLAYPNGDASGAVIEAARAAGYVWGLANRPGDLGLGTDDFQVPRRALGRLTSSFLGRRHSRAILQFQTEGILDRARLRRREREGEDPNGVQGGRPTGTRGSKEPG